ncbi:MAG: hypothetical protein F8N39_11660 [Clostridiaceae bacterium]|nr:hypothetical protein [Clostridiaceae bacterium]
MNNSFQFVISAVDKATATVRKVNQSVGKMTRPIGQVQAAVAALSKETGLDRVAKGLGSVGRAAVNVGGKITGLAAPMAAIIGVGSIAAVAALATEWGKLGAEIGRTSATLGVSVDQLQALRGAARLTGVSSDSLTGGLKSLGDTMQDALYGRNQEALVMMNRLGLRMKTTESGAVDSAAAFGDLAEAISRIKNPQVQGLVARTFGLEAALPLLRKGRAGVKELEDQMRDAGAIMTGPAVVAAASFQRSMGLLNLSIDGVRLAIGTALIPIIQPLIDGTREWLSANRELIATRVSEFAKGLAEALRTIDWDAVKAGAKSVLENTKSVVDWMGGWKNAAIAVAVVMNGALVSSVLNLGTALIRLSVAVIPAVVRSVVALGMALMATPVGWVTAALAVVAGAAYWIYENWAVISVWWSKLWVTVTRSLGGAWKTIQDTVTSMSDAVINSFKSSWDEFSDYWKGIWQGVIDTVKEAADLLSPIIEKITNGVRAVTGAARKVASTVSQSAVGRAVGRAAGSVGEGIRSIIGGPIGIRQNNPGNLRSWGDAPINRGYAQFKTAGEGISAMAGNLQAYGRHGWDSIESIISHWAPAGDNNNVPAYIADLVKQTGFSANAKLDLSDPKTLNALIPAIIKHENGGNPYDAGLIAQSISSRLGRPVEVPNAPAEAPGQPVATPYSAPVATPGAVQTSPATPAPAAGEPASVNVKVSFEGAPAGTRVQPDTKGPAADDTRVSYAMPMGAVG